MKRFLKKISRMLSIIMIITLIPKVAYSEVNDFGENASEIQTNEESNFQEQIGEESNSQDQAEDSQERIDEKNNSEVQANEGSNSQEQVEDSQEQIGEKNNSEAQTDEESNSDSAKYPNTFEIYGLGVEGMNGCRAIIGFNNNGYGRGLAINVDVSDEKAPTHGYKLHRVFANDIYFSIKVFKSNGELEFEKEFTGSNTGDDIAKALNGKKVEYGDILQLYHREAESRCVFKGSIIGGNPNGNEKNESIFKITPFGLEKCEKPTPKIKVKDDLYIFKDSTPTKEKIWEGIECKDEIQQVFEEKNKETVITCNGESVNNIDTSKIGDNQKVTYTVTNNFGKSASVERTVYIINEEYPNIIEIHGKNYQHSGDLKDEIKFNVKTKQLEVTPKLTNNANGTNFLHSGYKDNEYFSIKIFDANGQIKLNETFRGVSTTQKVADVLNNFQFDYGYIIKMFHAEPDRLKFKGEVINGAISQSEIGSKNSSWFLEITPFGLRSDAVVDIPDEILKAKLNKKIDNNRSEKQIICKSNLEGLTGSLDIEGKQNDESTHVKDITGIEYCTNITELNLQYNSIVDLEPLRNLNNLKLLLLGMNKVESIEPLKGLTGLTKIGLGNMVNITDISPLKELTDLTILDLGGCRNLSDIGVLRNLTKLQKIWISNCAISDISPLKDLKSLTNVYIDGQIITLDKVQSVGSKATIGNVIKNLDGILLNISDGSDYTYNEENSTITFEGISGDCDKEYRFSTTFSLGNAKNVVFSGTVKQPVKYMEVMGCISIPKIVEMQKVTDSEYVGGTIDIVLEGEVGYSSIDVTMDPSLELTYNKDKYNKDKVKVDILNNGTIINLNGEVGTLTRENNNISLKLRAKKADFKYMNKVEYSGTLKFTFSN